LNFLLNLSARKKKLIVCIAIILPLFFGVSTVMYFFSPFTF